MTPVSNAQHHPTTMQILQLFSERGNSQYGREVVSQQEHALQAAFFAERANAGAALIAAALLHDIGHLLHQLPADAPEHGIDDQHEDLAARWLEQHFGPQVFDPVRLHVAAKRYLCTTDPDYFRLLSPPSIVSLELQGGTMSNEELKMFRARRFCDEAVALRRWDDAAKVPLLKTPPMEYYAVFIDQALQEDPRCLS